ncbi:HTH-type transcriptional regulator CysL [Granulicatella adiacens]|uniref:LysR family transcriptional regulator n=1 Tax=Granulicatella adiacens TaxID=46124 RepID=UPI00195A68FB|nr:LysR family transcriptional regulator [Granulicatella adiacens]VTX69210.1 HTH-type transcriptional regulator CysL [Granulicatella adiacens]
MNIDKLQTFKTLCETMSFTKTAEELYTSQPNITKQIKSLEEKLGYPLIHRTHKNFTLTEYGCLFYQTAVAIIEAYQSGLGQLRELADTTSRSIVIGATPFIGSKILPSLLPLLDEAFPDYQVSIKVDRSKVILADLEARKIQLAFFSEYIPVDLTDFKEKNLYEDHLVVICQTDHPLAKVGHCTIADLNEERYISKGNKSSLHKFLFSQLQEPAFMNRQPFVVDNQYSIKEAVAHGLGISIVSELLVKKDLECGYLAKLELNGFSPKRNIKLVYRKDYDPSIVQCVETLMKKLDI